MHNNTKSTVSNSGTMIQGLAIFGTVINLKCNIRYFFPACEAVYMPNIN